MKKKYAVDQIKPGVRFTADVYSDGTNLFVPADTPVRAKDIEGLKQWGVPFVYSEGNMESAATQPAEAVDDSLGKKGLATFHDRKLYAAYTDMIARLKAVMDRISTSDQVEPKLLDKLSQDVLQVVREKEALAIAAVLSLDIQGYDLARAGINCAILSVVVGQTMKMPAHRLGHLATGAMLHDVGMLRIPPEIAKKKGSLTPEEAQKIRAHPLLSYKIITKELQYPDDIGLIGLQHHERWDGAGYPRRSTSQDIDVLARIVSVADAFEAMVSQKPYRSSMIGYAAIKSLLSDNSRRFDAEVLKAFVKSMGIYPIGSIVVLNNAAIARVVDIHPDAPLRPRIKLIVDEFGKHFIDDSGETLDLLAEKALFIARAVDPRELASGQ